MANALPYHEPYPRYREPIHRVSLVRSRLALVQPVIGDDHIDWNVVQSVVEDALAELAIVVRRLRPEVASRSGANHSPAVLLYAYTVFALESEADPVVAGIAFVPSRAGILVRGELCGEESGILYFAPPTCRQEVAASGRAVMRAAGEVAALLSRQADRLIEAIAHAEDV